MALLPMGQIPSDRSPPHPSFSLYPHRCLPHTLLALLTLTSISLGPNLQPHWHLWGLVAGLGAAPQACQWLSASTQLAM